MKVLEILEPFSSEFIFYSHAFEWVFESGDGELPRGMEVCRFANERTARAAIEHFGVRNEEKDIFVKIRSYLSRYAR